MKACFQIAECSLFYSKNSASECNETMFSDCLIRSGMYKKGCGAGPFRLTFHSIRNVPVRAFPCSAVV